MVEQKMDKICKQICKPVDDKLDQIWNCVKTKTSQKLFLTLIGALAFFTIVIMGGLQWRIIDKLSNIGTDVEVTKHDVKYIQIDIDRIERTIGDLNKTREERAKEIIQNHESKYHNKNHTFQQQPKSNY